MKIYTNNMNKDKKYYQKKMSKLDNAERKRVRVKTEKERIKYGIGTYDAYDLSIDLARIIANGIYIYLRDATSFILRDDFDELEKAADSILAFGIADSFDAVSRDRKVSAEYRRKEREFKKAMKLLVDKWQTLWW